MTIEIDRKEGTEPESQQQKKKKTVTIDRKAIYYWWIFLVSVGAWMFYLGILVGRESAPVYFDATHLDPDMMAMVGAAVNPESSDVVLPETTESQDLEFFEALKDNKGGVSKKVAELEALQSRSKLAALEPERLPVSSNQAGDEDEGEAIGPAAGHSNGNSAKSKDHVSSKAEGKAATPETKASDTKSDAKKTNDKSSVDKKSEEKKSDPKKTEKTAESPKKEIKTADSGSASAQKQESKNAAPAAKTDKPKDPKKESELKSTTAVDSTAKKSDKTQDSASKTADAKNAASKEAVQKNPEIPKVEKVKESDQAKSQEAKTGAKPVDSQAAAKKEQSKPVKYAIQSGAYTTQKDADASAKKIAAAGFAATVVKGKGSDGKEWYRIRVGTYGEKEKASKTADNIKKAGFPAMIINVPQE